MVIEQTVEIPANRRITIEVPPVFPVGKNATILLFTPERFESAPEKCPSSKEAIEKSWGIAKQFGSTLTSDDFLEQRRKDREFEYAKDCRLYGDAVSEK
ncbi:hypothetical protein LJC14_07490 [Treponema sp. OttesenSCG-928-L16]|nr:hypothetical protein [Treponema sp. OttesenSCG-928-L16]